MKVFTKERLICSLKRASLFIDYALNIEKITIDNNDYNVNLIRQ